MHVHHIVSLYGQKNARFKQITQLVLRYIFFVEHVSYEIMKKWVESLCLIKCFGNSMLPSGNWYGLSLIQSGHIQSQGNGCEAKDESPFNLAAATIMPQYVSISFYDAYLLHILSSFLF